MSSVLDKCVTLRTLSNDEQKQAINLLVNKILCNSDKDEVKIVFIGSDESSIDIDIDVVLPEIKNKLQNEGSRSSLI